VARLRLPLAEAEEEEEEEEVEAPLAAALAAEAAPSGVVPPADRRVTLVEVMGVFVRAEMLLARADAAPPALVMGTVTSRVEVTMGGTSAQAALDAVTLTLRVASMGPEA